ncbi:TonB-dependent siderophore receptor [Moraxella sp. ZY210820]|uniref:TonB-dependent receptor n=1 Tax=unclassified Moraxella TaxID=2685852 RepID=UPI00272F7F03|nr:TonB-dependent siderophore receptor [Moraxella sp. ZY210820]WLF84931.1 TonB-dependent siderophore receptor [Moraxella sp. ZY210820]
MKRHLLCLVKQLNAIALLGLAFSTQIFAQDVAIPSTVLPTIEVEAMEEGDPIKTYVDYKQANVTRNGLDKKDIPQTIDTIDVVKYKLYGANDLSVMLQGTPGVSTNYDMRGDGISIRGFSADTGDIYRDGIRESGQVRRSTANVERIEILKGPASVLYGRSAGGGVMNMVSKYANFSSKSSLGVYAGSYDNVGGTLDINRVLNNNWAVRLTGEKSKSDSFRRGISSELAMISPSISYRNDDETLLWTTQFTYDKLERVPDRSPRYEDMPKDVSLKMGFAHPKDFVDDELKVLRTDLKYEYLPNWKFHWALSHREASQNFDHFYTGLYCATDTTQVRGNLGSCNGHAGEISQNYYWQQTDNKTTSNTWDITGEFLTGHIKHNIMLGTDWIYEQREPRLANQNAQGQLITGYLNPYTGQYSENNRDGTLKIRTHNYNQGTNYGVFLQDLISFSDQYKLMLGLRYDYYDFSTTNKLNGDNRQVKNKTISPNIGLVWQPIPQQSIYASYSRSFAPFGGNMGVSMVGSTEDLSRFNMEPTYNDQYEIGLKSDWFNQRLNTQLSAYHIKKHNLRYLRDREDPTSWASGAEMVSKGAEFSVIGRVLDNLYVRGGYGYNDVKTTKNPTNANEIGKRPQNTSKHTGNIFVRYLPTEQIYAELGATYVGDFYANNTNTEKIDGFTRLDGAIGFKNDQWSITLAGNNLTNKQYWRSGAMPGTPRNVLLRVNYLF